MHPMKTGNCGKQMDPMKTGTVVNKGMYPMKTGNCGKQGHGPYENWGLW